jgi:hypothetical protein
MQAFAEGDSLGVIAVDEVPGLLESRAALLPLAAELAALPKQVLDAMEHPENNYLIGWSRGTEILASGVPDVNKGSFYANPLLEEANIPDNSVRADRAPGAQPRVRPRS